MTTDACKKLSTDEKNCLWIKEEFENGIRDIDTMANNIWEKHYKDGSYGNKVASTIRKELPMIVKNLHACGFLVAELESDKKSIKTISSSVKEPLTPELLKTKLDTIMMNGDAYDFDYVTATLGGDVTYPWGPIEIRVVVSDLYKKNLGYVYSTGKIQRKDDSIRITDPTVAEHPLVTQLKVEIQDIEKKIADVDVKIADLTSKFVPLKAERQSLLEEYGQVTDMLSKKMKKGKQ